MDHFALLSQAHQAIALEAQIEHYRRWRSQVDEHGLGRTMCAMYWQLNDVWAAPSWSSIDFDLRWKFAHHFVRRAFAPLIVSMFMDSIQQAHLFVISDLTVPLRNVTLQLRMFVLQLGFQPIFFERIALDTISAQSAVEVQLPMKLRKRIGKQMQKQEWHSKNRSQHRRGAINDGVDNDFLVSAILFDEITKQPLCPEAILLPDQFYNAGHYGQAKIVHFEKRHTDAATTTNKENEFALRILANNVLPLVWLDLSDQFKMAHPEVLYHFEENAFAQTQPYVNVTLKVFSNPNAVQIKLIDILVYAF